MSEVIMEHVTKIYRSNDIEIKAADDINFTVNKGEYIVIVGPSGSGKSTILKLIAGLIAPDKGNIYIDNVLVNNVPPKERNIGMVFQSYALYPHMSIYDNIAFPLKVRKLPKHEIDKKVRAVSELLGITHIIYKKPSEISGGEAQRTALARALVKEPRLLLLDEPLSNIDVMLRATLRSELKKLQRKLGITIIHVTHDQVEAFTLGDRIIVLHQGRVAQIGTPLEILYKPKNIFVASFIGHPAMNIIRGKLLSKASSIIFVDEKRLIKIPLKSMPHTQLNYDDTYYLGIRPEDISLHSIMSHGIKESGEESVIGEIQLIEPQGTHSIVHVKIGDIVIKTIIETSYMTEFRIGSKIFVTINTENIKIFDSLGNIIE